MIRVSFIATLAAVLGGLLAVPAHAVGTRTFVASYGNDANTAFSCNLTHPCRLFATAFAQTTTGGEIVAIDAGGYGRLTIDRSVSIIANPGVFAGIGVGADAVNGITIATAGVNVVLRGLTITGLGGTYGVDMSNGARLSIENCVFANFSGGTAINVHAAATVYIINTLVRDGSIGVSLSSGAAASISGSQFLGNSQAGIVVNATASATVSNSMATRNGTGLSNGGGTLTSLGNNNVTDNTTANTSGAITGTPLM